MAKDANQQFSIKHEHVVNRELRGKEKILYVTAVSNMHASLNYMEI